MDRELKFELSIAAIVVAVVLVATYGATIASAAGGAFIVDQGGTGWQALTANTILLGNGKNRLATTTAGTNGQYLVLLNQVPTWATASSTSAVTSVTASWPVVSSNGTTPNITWSNVAIATSSVPSSGTIAAWNSSYQLYGAATSTLFGTGTGGQLLTWANGVPTWTATSTYTAPLSFNAGTNVVSITAGSAGQVLAYLNGAWTGAATTTLTNTSPVTTTYSAATNQWTVACATCNTSSATVTSITGGTGLNGGVITTAGTLALKSYLATSTADTANQISVFTSTNATPATFGGFANFTFNSSTNLFTVINASTTNEAVSQSLFVNSVPVSGYVYASYDIASSTAWTATTTRFMEQTFVSTTYSAIKCNVRPSGAKLNIQIGNGAASTTMVTASSTNNTFAYSSPTTFAAGSNVQIDVGTPVSSPTEIICTTKRTQGFQ